MYKIYVCAIMHIKLYSINILNYVVISIFIQYLCVICSKI